MKDQLDALLTEIVDGQVNRFVWLRQFEVGSNSAGASSLLDRLEFLRALELSPDLLEGILPHRITRLRRQGERYFADGLRDITSDRRLAIFAVCAIEWAAAIADAVIETHDRIVGKTWRDAKKLCDARLSGCQIIAAGNTAFLQGPRCGPAGSQERWRISIMQPRPPAVGHVSKAWWQPLLS